MAAHADQQVEIVATGLGLSSPAATGKESVWFLSGQFGGSEIVRHFPIHSNPFRIGRRTDLSLCLPFQTVSNMHAELIDCGDFLSLRNLQSTNGTYVNGNRVIGEVQIKVDDLVQFADVAFRIRQQAANINCRTLHEDVCDQALALVQFDNLMAERSVIPFFQPIVDMHDLATIGYEVLGRSRLVGLETPAAMFQAASQLNLEVELSRMFRWEGIQASASLPELPHLFVNTHPAELVAPGLMESMRACRGIHPHQKITLEIHEAAVTNPALMNELRAELSDLDIGLAYDDFGAGQTRLVELVEVPPNYLKFDISLVRGIHLASTLRQQMLGTLIRMVRELGIVPLAEGIECEAESETCGQLGFELGQGFHYGKPAPISTAIAKHQAEQFQTRLSG